MGLFKSKASSRTETDGVLLGQGRRLRTDLSVEAAKLLLEAIAANYRPRQYEHLPQVVEVGWSWMGGDREWIVPPALVVNFTDDREKVIFVAFWPNAGKTEMAAIPLDNTSPDPMIFPLPGHWKQQDGSLSSIGNSPSGLISIAAPKIPEDICEWVLRQADMPLTAANFDAISQDLHFMYTFKCMDGIGRVLGEQAAERFTNTHKWLPGQGVRPHQSLLDDFAQILPAALPYMQDFPLRIPALMLDTEKSKAEAEAWAELPDRQLEQSHDELLPPPPLAPPLSAMPPPPVAPPTGSPLPPMPPPPREQPALQPNLPLPPPPPSTAAPEQQTPNATIHDVLQSDPAKQAYRYAHGCRAVTTSLQNVLDIANKAHGARQVAAQRPQQPASIQTFVRQAEKYEREFIEPYKQFVRICGTARDAAAQFRRACAAADPPLDPESEMLMKTGHDESLYGAAGIAIHILATDYGSTVDGFLAGLEVSNHAIQGDIYGFGEEGFLGHVYAPPQEAVSDEQVCPWCAETIKAAAIICRFCNRDVADAPASTQ